MGFYPKKQLSAVDLRGTVSIGGVALTAGAVDLNRTDVEAAQTLVADGAITVKNGVCVIAKTVAGVVNATLADPVATTDDFKRLTIINGQAQLNVITSASAFGNGGAGEDVATMSATVGDTLNLMAYQGKWYITGAHQATIA